MKSFRFILLLLCCIVSWACNSVLGTDDFKKSGCIEGEVRCAGDRPERCSSGSWQAEGACNGQTCIDGACVGECAPDKKQCNGQQPQRCDELSGNWTNDRDPCTNTTCSDGACVGICAPGQTSCSSDNFPRTCDSNGQWANAANACANQTCIDGACVGECAPGKRCLGVTPQHCDAQGTWASDPLCQVDEYCEGGECTLECVPLDLRCWNNTPQVCNETKRWQDIQGPCEHQTCNPTTVMCDGVCAPAERQCNGSELQGCDPSGHWQHEIDCPTECMAGECIISCTDSLQNGNETDIDCGGTTCMRCDDGKQCLLQSDCISNLCINSMCGAAACVDMIQNGAETDVDCGGPNCKRCANFRKCILGADCESLVCGNGNCIPSTCTDGVKNGQEGGVDCGLACPLGCLVGEDCLVDADCVSTLCQPASKTCVQKSKGSACTIDSECGTGYCVDSVCCSSSCTGECQACTAGKKGSGVTGDCGPIAYNTDPDGECPVTVTESCGNTGVCSGTGSCEKYALGTVCDVASCTNSTTENPADTCNGQGVCIQKFDMPCQMGYVCVAGACKTTCVSNGECATGYFCNAPTCQIKKTNGDSCSYPAQCQTGNCIDGVCCDTLCTDTCKACNVAGNLGTCSPLLANTDPINECSPGQCDGGGQCQRINGSSCSTPNQCVSGNCVDGVCCNTSCIGTCISCANMGSVGVCTNIPANADPSNECNPGQCDGLGDCQGVNSDACLVPTDCASGFCVDGYCCDSACTGTCMACSGAIKGQGANGTCAAILYNQDPGNECNPGACNGVGACQSPSGLSCTGYWQCASNICADGVCCNTACTGACQACSAAKTGGTDGTCSNIPGGSDPDNECAGSSTCNGFGACQP